MSFLDNLENNLKSLENREERDPREAQRRESERTAALASAPWSSRLRDSAYVKQLLGLAARAGIQRRTKIMPAWLDGTLRLSLRSDKLDLRPTPQGIVAAFLKDYDEVYQQPVSLESDPAPLLEAWLAQTNAVQA